MCFENKITPKKHMNKKHKVYNCDTCSAEFTTSMTLLKHMAYCQEGGKKDKFCFDEYGFCCIAFATFTTSSFWLETFVLRPPILFYLSWSS